MLVHVLTLFPAMFPGPLQYSIVGRAMAKGLLQLEVIDIRSYTHDLHQTADDYQYGGGAGMVMKPGPIFEAVEAALQRDSSHSGDAHIILLSPQGEVLNQGMLQELARKPALLIIAGRYEGVDERVRDHLVTHDVSIGDYVLSGGELAAMVLVEGVARLLPGVVGSVENVEGDSITSGVLQHPVYSRPQVYRGWEAPPVLLSGNHQEITRWRRQQALLKTLQRRPDLLDLATLSRDDKLFLESQGWCAEA